MEQPTLWKLITAIPRGLAFVIVGVGSFLATQWKQYTPFGQMLWALALAAITVDCGIAYEFGSSLSQFHAIGFALVSLAFCLMPDVAAMEFRKGKKRTGGWIAAACIPLGLVAFLTHVGYSASIRVGDFQQSDVSNAKYDDARTSVQEATTAVKLAEDNLKSFTDRNPWVTSVTADGMTAEAATMDEAIRQEERRGGCGPKCLALKQQQADLVSRAAAATHKTDLEKQRTAAVEWLKKAKTKADGATYVSSTAVNHTDTLFKAVSLVTGQFAEHVTMTEREATNTGIVGLSSMAFLMLAVLFNFGAGLNRRPGVLDAWIYGEKEPEDIWQRQAKRNGDVPNGNPSKAPGAHLREEFTINDHRGVNELKERLASNHQRALAILNGAAA